VLDKHKNLKDQTPPQVDVVVEIPRGSILKRGSTGQLDFVSPIPCPFNYGSVPGWLGLEGDLLDAVVLGPRLRAGSGVRVQAFGAVGMADRGMYDDKLICSRRPLTRWQRFRVSLFFRFYARSKGLLNLFRGRPGRTAYVGWFEARDAIARARPLGPGEWRGPAVPF
jgi:inorganic pyrophosphatase